MGQIVTTDTRLKTVRELIQRQMPGLQRAVPRGIDHQRFARITLSTIRTTPKLLECDPITLVSCMMQAGAWGLDLDPGLGFAYLVPYKQRCQLIVGYQGLVELARRSGFVRTIMPRAVREHDHFRYAYGLDERLEHIPVGEDRPGALQWVYAVAHVREPAVMPMQKDAAGVWDRQPDLKPFDVMSIAEVEAIRKRSASRDSGPWITDYEAMCKKTVIRRLCKYLPKSIELAHALRQDEQADQGEDQDFGEVAIDLPGAPAAGPAPATLDTLTAQLAATADVPSPSAVEATAAPIEVPTAAPHTPGLSAADTSRAHARTAQASRHEPRRDRQPGEEG